MEFLSTKWGGLGGRFGGEGGCLQFISVVCGVSTPGEGSGVTEESMRSSASCKNSVVAVAHVSVDGLSRTYFQNWDLYPPMWRSWGQSKNSSV